MLRKRPKTDGYLTLASVSRRKTGASASALARTHCRRGKIAALLGGLLLSGNTTVNAGQWQQTGDISTAAEVFLRTEVGIDANDTTVIAGRIDSRHRLAQCDKPLQAFFRRGSQIRARTIVGVRCVGKKPWKVYVPVDVVVTKQVLVARRTLPRGHILTDDDVVAERRDVSRLLSGYLSDPAALAGQRLKVQLLAGKILTPALLSADRAVKRGQTVTLMVGKGDYSIHFTGIALTDGALNQRIRVENKQSGRVVEGIVRSRETVEVLVASTAPPIFNAKPKGSANGADTRLSNNDR